MKSKISLTPDIAEQWCSNGVPSRKFIDNTYKLWGLSEIFGLWENSELRQNFCCSIAFAVPCREAVKTIASAGPVAECGSGTGFWAACIANAGGDIVACDSAKGPLSPNYHQPIGRYFTVQHRPAVEFVKANPHRNLLMVWPSYWESWATKAAMALSSGRTLFLVSEGPGGCVADDSLFVYLEQNFSYIEEIRIPQWTGIHDTLDVWKKR